MPDLEIFKKVRNPDFYLKSSHLKNTFEPSKMDSRLDSLLRHQFVT